MKVLSFYIYLTEKIRILHNYILYSFLSLCFSTFKTRKIEVFSDSNGWFFTFRYLNKIYKVRWFLSFIRYGFCYKELRENINELVTKTGCKFTPNIKINAFFISQDYISDSQNFNEYVASINNSKGKNVFFIRVVNLIQELHRYGFCHGDLKAKNILVDSEGAPFFIDLEFLSRKKTYSKKQDYIKFFESAFFWLNEEELDFLAFKSDLDKEVKDIIVEKYFINDVVATLRNESYILFEKNNYEEGEDIDVYVENHKDFKRILFLLKHLGYKFNVHYCFCDDIKIYVNSRNKIIVLDIHLEKRIAFWFLCYKKIFKNKVICIYLTGPDGVGKTTLIDDIIEKDTQNIFQLLNIKKIHANRFHKEVITFFWLKRFVSFLSRMVVFGIFVKKITILILKFKEKSKLVFFDRSFLDSMIQKRKINRISAYLVFYLVKKDFIVLMQDHAKNINSRKKELSVNEIEKYYNDFFHYGRKDYIVYVEDLTRTAYKLNSIVKFKVMKDLFQ